MALRCVLFSSDPASVEPIRQVLADLDVEGEYCSEAVAAVDKVCRESFQIVIVDWDKQPEAGTLLAAARERKLAERPLTLAIVSEDAGVPKALQAGANSILRKPVVAKQVSDSLARARDLLRARESAAQAAAAGVGVTAASAPASLPSNETTLRAGEFLQPAGPATQFDTESEMQKSLDQSAAHEVNALKELEPMASAVQASVPPPSDPDEPRGLQWYLKQRAAAAPGLAQATPAPVPAPSSNPELLGYDQAPSHSAPVKTEDTGREEVKKAAEPKEQEKKEAAELFAYIAGEDEQPSKGERPRMRLGKGAIIFASALAACAVVAAPQAPWNPQLRKVWGRGKLAMHAWLNPQLVTPTQAPTSHENFGRAGDEYKLPVAENIPDATTDPSQIKVTPMVDPTAKKPNNGVTADPNLAPADAGTTNAADPAQSPGMSPTQSNPTSNNPIPNGAIQNNPAQGNPNPDNSTTNSPSPQTATQPGVSNAAGPTSLPITSVVASTAPSEAVPSVPVAPPKNPQPRPVSASSTPPIPSSLKSQMASMTPEASGNKAPEAALPSIEPVNVPEATERTLLTDQPALAYPENGKGQQGAVVLQVLIGRDGTVQDAKFLQGSLAFARTAIDGVKQWKFKPYIMNGRAVSVQTNLTLSFKPGQ